VNFFFLSFSPLSLPLSLPLGVFLALSVRVGFGFWLGGLGCAFGMDGALCFNQSFFVRAGGAKGACN
jgi:hypothetical protein